jgi:hypothetical protein
MIDWVKSKVSEITTQGVITILAGTGKLLLQFDEVFLIVAMIGVYFIIFGNRKMGTKITSISTLLYFLAGVISKC